MEVAADTPLSAAQLKNQPSAAERRSMRRLEFFWLCGHCARQMTLAFDRGRGVVVVPTHTQRAVAS
jgi:hypothetical protein